MVEGEVLFVRRKGQKSIRMRASGSGVTVSYPYRYPLFLVKRSVFSGNNLEKLYARENKKKEKLLSLFLDEKVFETHSLKERKVYIEEHKEVISNLIATYAAEMGVAYHSVVFKRMRSRFGSCSSKGVLTFHYKICFMNDRMKRYLIIHELAHLVHMNHSKDFWGLVGSFVLNMEESKQELLLLSSYL